MSSNQDTPWQYHGDKNSSPAAPLSTASDPTPSPIASAASGGAVSWEAPEYLAHQRGFGWYVLLAIGGVGVAALIYWITRDIFASVSIVIAAGIIGAFALRQPQTIAYSLSPSGLTIGSKTHPYNSFKSFSHVSEGAKPNVLLLPAKRFMAPITLHFEPKEEEKIIQILGQFLPRDEHKLDNVERLSRHLRF